jgi:hypothetical protein
MSTETTLKRQNAPYLWTFFTFNVIAFLFMFFASHFEIISRDVKAMLTFRSSGILIAPLLLFIINGLLSSKQKAILVFWNFKNPLPGSRAFSLHGLKDSRVNMNKLLSHYNPLPVTPEEQNALWYKLYRQNITDIVVQKSHREFLLGRDLVAMSFLFIILVAFPMLFLGLWPLSLLYLGFLFLQYFIMLRIAQNHGRRFVTNILAIESAKF